MKKLKFDIFSLISLSALASSPLQAQMVPVYPPEISGALTNPLMGFRGEFYSAPDKSRYTTVVHHYIPWNAIENHEDDSVQKIRDYCDYFWSKYPAQNVKVIPRVYLSYYDSQYRTYWPSDIPTEDISSPKFRQRLSRLISRLGEVWDEDPRVAFVQTGIIGLWGEQENPGITGNGLVELMDDAFGKAFINKKLTVRNMDQWPRPNYGIYWDSFNHPDQPGVTASIRSLNSTNGRYLNQIVEGEFAWRGNGEENVNGTSPTSAFSSALFTDNIIDGIRDLHTTALGKLSYYDVAANGMVQPNAVRAQSALGYRFHVSEFASTPRVEPGANLNVQFKVKNTGSAPFYENWPVAVVLIDEITRQIVWKTTLPNVDVRSWRPGENYNKASNLYETLPLQNQINATIPIPANLSAGQYLVGLSILEPVSQTPGVFFAVPNFFKESQSQPLMRIGVGANASSPYLTGMVFDDLVSNDTRYYNMPQGIGSEKLPTAGWVPSASSTSNIDTLARALDGDRGSRWSTGTDQANGQWFQVDMLSPKTFNRITLDSVESPGDYTRGYQVHVSNDGTNWGSPIASGSNLSATLSIPLANQTARFIRVTQTGSASGAWWSIHEFEVFAPAPTALAKTGWVPTASSTSNFDSLGAALDGNAGTRWSSGSPQTNGQWFQVNMGTVKSFDQIALDTSGSKGDFPRGYEIRVSTNGTNWSAPIATGSGIGKFTSVKFPMQNAQYIRVTQTGSVPAIWWSIHEFDVYVAASNLPSPWQSSDIGAVGVSGSTTFSSPTWTITGSGSDIWNNADAFRYVYQNSNGDCSVVTRVASISNTDVWAKSGVMIRESAAPGAINAAVLVTPANGVTFQWRGVTDGGYGYTQVWGHTAPKWLKITRTGNSIAAFYSDNGTLWTQVGTAQTVNMTPNATIGLALTSHNNGTLCTSTMNSVTATP